MENITIANVVEVSGAITGIVGMALVFLGIYPYLTATGARRLMEHDKSNIRMAAVGLAFIVLAFGVVDPFVDTHRLNRAGSDSESTASQAVHAHGVAADARAEDGAPLDPPSNIAVTMSAARALAHGHRQTTDPTSGITAEHGGTI